MKNELCFFLLCLLACTLSAEAQRSGKVVYKKKMVIEDTMFNSLKKDNPEQYKTFAKEAKNIAKIMEKFSYDLRFQGHEAIFEQQDILLKEPKYAALKNMEGDNYTNLQTETTLEQVNISGAIFLVKREKPEWQITQEHKTIAGFKCIKAITEKEFNNSRTGKPQTRTIVAWFTPELPVSFGPKGYFGLPGLIVELYVTPTNKFYLTDLDFSSQDVKIEPPKKGKKVSEKEFRQIMKEMNAKFLEMRAN